MTEADVQLVCPTELMAQALELILKRNKYMVADDLHHDTDGIDTAYFQNANPHQQELSVLLEAAGIPHTIDIMQDYDVDPMSYHVRFTPDFGSTHKYIPDDELTIGVQSVYELLDKPDELRALITKRFDALQVLPWDNQLEYSLPARAAARIHRSSHHE